MLRKTVVYIGICTSEFQCMGGVENPTPLTQNECNITTQNCKERHCRNLTWPNENNIRYSEE